jgi:hypothetical protein
MKTHGAKCCAVGPSCWRRFVALSSRNPPSSATVPTAAAPSVELSHSLYQRRQRVHRRRARCRSCGRHQARAQAGSDKVRDGQYQFSRSSRRHCQIHVVAVASTSAVCEVQSSTRDLVAGDTVSLPDAEVEKLVAKNTLGNTRQYPMVISFTEGDPLDEEVRAALPRPPLPEVNQIRGRIGFDVSTIRQIGQGGGTPTPTAWSSAPTSPASSVRTGTSTATGAATCGPTPLPRSRRFRTSSIAPI